MSDKEIFTLDWGILGARLARLSTTEQIPFFRQFANEMLSYESDYEKEMQLAFIREGMDKDGLNKEQRKIFASLGYDGE